MVKRHPHADPNLWAKMQPLVQQMRHEPTPAENLLWQLLRSRQLSGYKFRRQHPIDRFIADFCCPKAALIIEVDGAIHDQQIEADQERQQILTEFGFRVLRFTNTQVLEQSDQVLQEILEALGG